MTRQRRKPAPPGRVHVICTARGEHDRKHLITLQAVTLGGSVAFTWRGTPPVSNFAHEDGSATYVFRCGRCRRNPRYSQDRLAQIVMALAEAQGNWDTPVVLDVSAVERA